MVFSYSAGESFRGFIACRNVVIKDNQFVFRRAQVQVDINIGSHTDPSSFRSKGTDGLPRTARKLRNLACPSTKRTRLGGKTLEFNLDEVRESHAQVVRPIRIEK